MEVKKAKMHWCANMKGGRKKKMRAYEFIIMPKQMILWALDKLIQKIRDIIAGVGPKGD